ncbi:iron chelate uptake ABC transporter family permease subunit, partial [Gemmiger sp.]
MNNWQTSSIRRPKCLFWAALLLLTILAAAGSLWLGSVAISPAEVFSALLGQGGNSTAAKIVLFSRLPRTLAALLSGAALAVSGAVIQTVLNNPLASPGIIGVNSGAGLAVALLCAAAPAAQRFSAVAAFIGALLSVLLVLGLSERTGASR